MTEEPKKVLCLFNKVRTEAIEKIAKGEENDNFLFGMLRLEHFGYPAETMEIEQYFSPETCAFLRRRILNIHFAHLPLLRRIFKYDIVFTSTAFGTLLFWALWPFKKPKWVMFDFNLLGIIGNKKSIRQKIFAWSVSRSSGIVALSLHEEQDLKKEFPHLAKKIKFIPLGTDIKYFSPKPEIKEEYEIFSPGRDPGRDYATLFGMVRGLDWKVKVTARPAKLEKYQPLPSNVSVHDLTPKELLEEYAKAKIVVLPLRIGEEYNNAMGCSTLVEAMAMGKAVIATRSATMESHIEDGVTGVLVPQNDPKALREAVEALLADEPKRRRLGEAARKFAVEYCEAEKYAGNLARFFNGL